MAPFSPNGGGWEIRTEHNEVQVSLFVQFRQELTEGGRFDSKNESRFLCNSVRNWRALAELNSQPH